MGKLGRNPFQQKEQEGAKVADAASAEAPEKAPRRKTAGAQPRIRSRALRAERGLCPVARQAVKLAAGAVVLGFKGTLLAREAVRTTFGI